MITLEDLKEINRNHNAQLAADAEKKETVAEFLERGGTIDVYDNKSNLVGVKISEDDHRHWTEVRDEQAQYFPGA